jgi:hypothetical protein
VNRSARRQARKAPRPVQLLADQGCPDCSSETSQPVADRHGVWHVNISHDDTCPLYAQLRRDLA